MEEDISEIKQMDFKSNSDEMNETDRKREMQILEEKNHVNVSGDFKLAEKMVLNVENKEDSVQTSLKRKFHDKAAVGNNDIVKRRCRWNSDGLKVPEPQSGNVMGSTTPKDSIQPPFKRSFSRSDSRVSEEEPKELPPASVPPTNSLRIDRFLRPFTLKAVQELLGKKGTITSFWMDHIKTHCYVSYSSIEEAIETRNAVYNLQWPPNGGRMLVAEFVDPQEVKTRVEVPPPSPATPSSSAAPTFAPQNTLQSQPSAQHQVQRQQLLPPPPLPPPPPLANPPTAREHPLIAAAREQQLPVKERLNLPPPPPLSEKVDPPIVTLDDLFQKTKATPRIYYLPLSDEQVAAKLKAQWKNGSSRD
ncbi:Uncharacterized protein Adt_24324 [Abeliophyllum distichum]|uniref:Uncharacterized protein n=1 Tax=Abeliophyllum distichum TaxID=126358 RepID=A0ABD1SGI8_9LAMI